MHWADFGDPCLLVSVHLTVWYCSVCGLMLLLLLTSQARKKAQYLPQHSQRSTAQNQTRQRNLGGSHVTSSRFLHILNPLRRALGPT